MRAATGASSLACAAAAALLGMSDAPIAMHAAHRHALRFPAALLLVAALLLGAPGAALEPGTGPDAALQAQATPRDAQPSAAGQQAAAADGRLAAAAAAAAAEQQQAEQQSEDDSVRCRLSGICEGPSPDCGPGLQPADPLACLVSDAERAQAVQAAARHAWGGYRCAACWAAEDARAAPGGLSGACRRPRCWLLPSAVAAFAADARDASPPACTRTTHPLCSDCARGEDAPALASAAPLCPAAQLT